MHAFLIIILVGTGGFGGALFRYFLFQFSKVLFPNIHFPLSTLIVNVLGSFFLGLLFSVSLAGKISIEGRLFLATGFLGSLTTFSTYTWDSFQLIKQGEYFYFISYFLLNNFLSLLALILGYCLIKQG